MCTTLRFVGWKPISQDVVQWCHRSWTLFDSSRCQPIHCCLSAHMPKFSMVILNFVKRLPIFICTISLLKQITNNVQLVLNGAFQKSANGEQWVRDSTGNGLEHPKTVKASPNRCQRICAKRTGSECSDALFLSTRSVETLYQWLKIILTRRTENTFIITNSKIIRNEFRWYSLVKMYPAERTIRTSLYYHGIGNTSNKRSEWTANSTDITCYLFDLKQIFSVRFYKSISYQCF